MLHHRIGKVLVLSALACSPLAGADTLVLEDNRRLTGDVTKNDIEYVLKLKSGIITKIPIADVHTWIKDQPAAASTPDKPASMITRPGTASPPARPAADPTLVLTRSSQSLALGLNAMKAGDARAAYENFLDSYQVLKANGVRIDANNPAHYTLLSCLTAACIATGDFPHAANYMDEASQSKLRDRTLIVNSAIVDCVQKVNALRGVKTLVPLLASLEDSEITAHEQEINVLGETLDYLAHDEANFNNHLFKQGTELYLHLMNALRKEHPRQVPWATRWLPVEEGRVLIGRFGAEYAAWKASLLARSAAQQHMKDAEANYMRLKGQHDMANKGGQRDLQLSLQTAQNDYNIANNAYEAIKDQPPKLKKAIDWPEWPPFAPMKPDVNAALAALAAPTARFAVNRSAVAVPIGPDLVLTSAAVTADAVEIQVTDSEGTPRAGKVVRTDGLLGLALVKLAGKPVRYLNLATKATFDQCVYLGYPDVSVDKPAPASVQVTASAPKSAAWAVSVPSQRPPRLPGAAVVDGSGSLIGIALGERSAQSAHVPTIPVDQIRLFVGPDVPKVPGEKAEVNDVLELRASH